MEPSCLSPKRKHIVLSTKVDTLFWEKGQQQQHTAGCYSAPHSFFEGGSLFFHSAGMADPTTTFQSLMS
jgi:hypothetical protein